MAGNSATNILSRLNTRFDHADIDREKPDFLTRDIGGHFRNNQPYISGYFQVIFGLPDELFGGPDRVRRASQWLHSTVESFTPHTQMLNKVDIMGQGQIGSSFISSITTTREFSMTFREYQNLPILNIIKRWTSVFDPFTGVSPLDGNRFIPLNYKGWCAVAQTKPVRSRDEQLTADDIEECYIYSGVFPTNIPLDALNSAISGNDVAELSMQFSFDNTPLTSAEPGVTDKVVELLAGMHMMGVSASNDNNSTYNRYWARGTGNETIQWGTHEGEVTSAADPDKGANPTKVPTASGSN
jgi:hypothetical protein